MCFARTLLQSPRVLLLDEATSSIDSVSDDAVQAMLRRCFAGRTVLTIAHRLKTIDDSDRCSRCRHVFAPSHPRAAPPAYACSFYYTYRVLVLERGRVREFAAPAALLATEGGAFRELWDSAGH